jgi:hypothetical protein
MPVSYAFEKGGENKGAILSLHDSIEPQSLEIVQKMLNAGEVKHIGIGNIDMEIFSSLNLADVRSIYISGGLPCYDLGFLAAVKKLELLRIDYGTQPGIGKNIRLDTLPSSDSLTSLTLGSVKELKNLPRFPNLKFINLVNINENLSFLSRYPSLKDVFISESSMQGFSQLLHCKNLVRLRMIQVRKVDFAGLVTDGTINSSLKILEISHCRDLITFDFLKQFPSLKYMDIGSSRNIASFEGIENCRNLEIISVAECRVRDKNLKYLLHINNVLLGMVYSKEEIANFAKEFKGKVYYINRAEKGYLDYGELYTKLYGGNIDDVPDLD